MTPNLFSFATSELSQDAFFAWLLSWGNTDADMSLRAVALDLLRKWTQNPQLQLEGEQPVQIKRQFEKIDLLVIVNEHYAIVVEDKTETAQHSGQLQRYKAAVEKHFPTHQRRFVYLKSGNACDFAYFTVEKEPAAVEQEKYLVFKRSDILKALEQSQSTNNIFSDFKSYLQQLEDKTSESIEAKSGYSPLQLQGFFMRLEDQIRPKEAGERIRYAWHQVNSANPFWVFSFGWRDFDGYQLYWQFDIYLNGKTPNRLVCKAHVQDEQKVVKANLKNTVLHAFKQLNPHEPVNDQGSNRSGKHLTLFEWLVPGLYPGAELSIERAKELVERGMRVVDTI